MSDNGRPELIPVRQRLWAKRLSDLEGQVDRRVRSSRLGGRIGPGFRVAVAVGSRGVANVDRIVAQVVRTVRALGGEPFVVPAMGSHGGGTAEGQVQILAELGVTEARVGAPVRSSMAVDQIGQTDDGMPVYCDRNALSADAIVVVNRVKKHTDINAPLESGLIKMISIGLGKKAQADLIHAYGAPGLRRYIPLVARVTMARAPIALGLATLENGYEETAELHAFEPEQIEDGERRLLGRNKRLLPRLPFEDIDVLIVDRMGKEISGTGMDTNVLGRYRIAGEPEPRRPRVKFVIVLDLTDASHGNAIGVGLADLTTERLVAKIDREATYVNGITSGFLERAKIPITLPNDREAIETALARLSPPRRARPRVARIVDTLHLAEFAVSRPLLDETGAPLEVLGEARPLEFEGDGGLVPANGAHPHAREPVLA
ncbi:MAG TPA: lactate racemase domain-containing protein [Chloroflexota bacterium]|jgi:hypothetical protein